MTFGPDLFFSKSKTSHTVPVKRTVTRGGRSFVMTVWKRPNQVEPLLSFPAPQTPRVNEKDVVYTSKPTNNEAQRTLLELSVWTKKTYNSAAEVSEKGDLFKRQIAAAVFLKGIVEEVMAEPNEYQASFKNLFIKDPITKRILGGVNYKEFNDNIYVACLAAHPDYISGVPRKIGAVGSRLLLPVLKQALKSNKPIDLSASPKAIPFYRAIGFDYASTEDAIDGDRGVTAYMHLKEHDLRLSVKRLKNFIKNAIIVKAQVKADWDEVLNALSRLEARYKDVTVGRQVKDFQKSKGTHTERRTVHRGGRVFQQTFHVGKQGKVDNLGTTLVSSFTREDIEPLVTLSTEISKLYTQYGKLVKKATGKKKELYQHQENGAYFFQHVLNIAVALAQGKKFKDTGIRLIKVGDQFVGGVLWGKEYHGFTFKKVLHISDLGVHPDYIYGASKHVRGLGSKLIKEALLAAQAVKKGIHLEGTPAPRFYSRLGMKPDLGEIMKDGKWIQQVSPLNEQGDLIDPDDAVTFGASYPEVELIIKNIERLIKSDRLLLGLTQLEQECPIFLIGKIKRDLQKSLNPPLYFGKSAMVQRLVDVKGPRGSYRARRWVNPDLWQKDQARVDLARLHTPITDKAVRDIATKWEKEIAAIIPGAMWHGKNLPYDIVTPKSLIEVKAIVSPKTFRLNVNKDEILKKKKFREIHGQKRKKEFIIGLDLRVNPKEPTVYMHNSVGAWRLGGKGQKMKQYTWAEFQHVVKTL